VKTKKRDLYEALRVLTRVADDKSAIPAARCVKLQARNGGLTATATDYACFISARLFAEGDIDACVPAKVLLDITKPTSRKDTSAVTIERHDENTVIVEVDGMVTRLASIPMADFPNGAGQFDWLDAARWKADELADSLDYVLRAVSRDDSRPHLCGVFFESTEGRAATTDGHRAHISPLPDSALPYSMLIPTASALMLQRILPQGDVVQVAEADDRVRFSVGMWELVTNLSNASFPPVDAIIPKNHPTHVTLDAGVFCKALDRVAKLAAKKGVRLVVNGEVTLGAVDPELGETQVVLEALHNDHEGDDLVIGLDPKYLREAVSADAETIRFNLRGRLDPLLVDLPDDKLAVVMPMRVA
jgi:DNA polymerase-3 subunit beta